MIRVASPERASDVRRPGRPGLGRSGLGRLGLTRFGLGMLMVSALAACGTQQPARHAARQHHQYSPGRYYPPPGPASDPWGPYIREASGRFGMPERWIRAVMRQESGGQEDVISWAGAMGLMQVMPETYDELRDRYGLGDDPFDPHNNILAGTAYLREMYDRFGSPGFLAAYNAGPNRVDRYMSGGTPLPEETVNYVANIAPRLGPGSPMSGPLAVYAGNAVGGGTMRVASRTPSGCDPDAAYNPDGPCTPLAPAPTIQPAVLETLRTPTPASCDPDAAYDPDRPCQPAPAAPVVASFVPPPEPKPSYASPSYASPSYANPSYASPPSMRSALVEAQPLAPPVPAPGPYRPAVEQRPARPPLYAANEPAARPRPYRAAPYAAPYHDERPIQESMTQRVAYRPIVPPAYTPPPPAHWSIQVGAYPSLTAAATAADNARTMLADARQTKVELLPTAPLGNRVAFRAQISGFTPSAASQACSRISGHGLPCITVPPQAS